MPEFEFNVRYKIDIDKMDSHDPKAVAVQYKFLPDSFSKSDATLTLNGCDAIMTLARESGDSSESNLVLKGLVNDKPADNILIFDKSKREFQLKNCGASIQGLKRDRENKFQSTDGSSTLGRADLSKRLKLASRTRKKKIDPSPPTTAEPLQSDTTTDNPGENI